MSFYVVSTEYVGPNRDDDQHADDYFVDIRTQPARTNSSHEPRINGWCGTTREYDVYAHGEYETVEAARDAIAEIFGKVREFGLDKYGNRMQPVDPEIVEEYVVGEYERLSRDATEDWIYEAVQEDVTGSLTNEQIKALVDLYDRDARSELSATVDREAAERMIRERVEELKQ